MYCRFSFALFCILGTPQLRAATPAEDWNCRQDDKGEWLCVTEQEIPESLPPAISKSVARPDKPKAEPARQTTVLQPVPDEPPRPKKTAQMDGWNCRAGEEDTWDCTLVGPNP
ncbi:MAG: hypothetical protein ABFS02_04720, partial [Pseudomonadota bacterium]